MEDDLSSILIIARAEEPGERMVVRGRVVAADGLTPLAGVRVFVYHADAEGLYTRDAENDPRKARLSGWLRTDGDGCFEVRSIRPAHYPNLTVPAHFHVVVTAPDGTEERFELRFSGDPLLTDEEREEEAREGELAGARPVERGPDGVQHVARSFRLRYQPEG